MPAKPTLLLFIVCSSLFACKENKDPVKATDKEPVVKSVTTGSEKTIQEVLDSIRSIKPMTLTINAEHSDVDELIPLGYNNHGSLAYLINENSGGASGLQFGIIPAYQDFKLESQLGMDDENDTMLLRNKELLYYALRSQGVKLGNSVQKTSADSLQKKYGIKFDVKKAYGAPYADDPSGKKTLASIEINWKQGDSMYPSFLYSEKYSPTHGVYDIYISDYLLIPGEEGLFGFVVIVTEGMGFEGYTRKSIEVKQIGVVKGK
jgi:hypothetical protein